MIEAHSDVHTRLDRIPEQILAKGTARCILEAICERNHRLLNDDQVRGLFAPLKRQFARAEYYLFELLQNAVDDGASHVQVRVEDSEQRLVLQHNGRPFTPVDVYGLSWVGLSGKFGRTIGFMGIGFKAVYKRFARVRVADQTWKFFFHEHPGKVDIDWEVLPVWDDAARDPEPPFICRFTLEEPRGGVARIHQDLGYLPDEVPVLLSRRALRSEDTTADHWRLDWKDRSICAKIDRSSPNPGTELLKVIDGTAQRFWRILTDEFEPSEPAVDEFRKFREDPMADPGRQEVSLFFEVKDGDVLFCPAGKVFAVLPTNVELPLGYHVQANWLLNSDRQDVQGLRDSLWNQEITRTLPVLLLRLLRWVAGDDGPRNLETVYRMLPELRHVSGRRVLCALGAEIDMSTLVSAVRQEPLVPVLRMSEIPVPQEGGERNPRLSAMRYAALCLGPDRRGNPAFEPGEGVLVLPASFLRLFSPRFLDAWLDRRVFAGQEVGDGRAFWNSQGILQPLDKGLLDARTQKLAELLFAAPEPRKQAWCAIRVMAVFQEAAGTAPADPPLHPNPCIFPTDSRKLARAASISRLAQDYFGLPPNIRGILNAHLDPSDQRLHMELQKVLTYKLPDEADEEAIRLREAARQLRGRIQTEVDVAELVRRFFKARVGRPLTGTEPDEVTELAYWACKANRPDVIDHVLVENEGQLCLEKTEQVYLGACYGEADVQTAGGSFLTYVSERYLSMAGPDKTLIPAAQWATLFRGLKKPVRHNPFLIWHRLETLDARSPQLHQWFDTNLPPTRWSGAPKELPQPFSQLGYVGNLQFVMIGADFPEPWRKALERLVQAKDGDAARAFASLLTRVLPEWTKQAGWILAHYIRPYKGVDVERIKTRPPAWIDRLVRNCWVPRHGGGLARPAEVLLEPDPTNPDAPVLDLPAVTRIALGLISLQLPFGGEVRREGPVARLVAASLRHDVPDQTIVRLWAEVIRAHRAAGDGERKETDRELAKAAVEYKLLPCGPPRSDHERRVSVRRAIGGNVPRATDLGRWLLRLGAPDCPLNQLAPELMGLLGLPEELDGERALHYLESVWREAPPMDSVRDHVVAAYRVLARELGQSQQQSWRPRWDALLQERRVKVYCKPPEGRGLWVQAHGGDDWLPVYDDESGKAACLEPRHKFAVEIMLARLNPREARERIVKLLGIPRLSEARFQIDERPAPPRQAAPGVTERLRVVLKSLRRLEAEETEPTDGMPEDLDQVTVHKCQLIRRSFRIDSGEWSSRETFASWKSPHEVLLAGIDKDYFSPLKAAVIARLDQDRLPRHLMDFLDMLLDLEDEERFSRKLREQAARLHLEIDHLLPQPSGQTGTGKAETVSDQNQSSQIPEGSTPSAPPHDATAAGPDASSFSSGASDADATSEVTAGDAHAPTTEATGALPPATQEEDVGGNTAPEEQGDLHSRQRKPGEEENQPGVGAGRPRPSPDPSRTHVLATGQAPNWLRVLARPSGDGEHTHKRGRPSPDDVEARKVVVQYENDHQRPAAEAATNQEGYDVTSEDAARRVKRLIEVKGVRGIWQGDATVALTGPQFDAARADPPPGLEYWLYVVDRVGIPEAKVYPLRWAASRVDRFYFFAQDWLPEVEVEAVRPLVEESLKADGIPIYDLHNLLTEGPEGRFAVRYTRGNLCDIVQPGGLLLFRRLRSDDPMHDIGSIVLVHHQGLPKFADGINNLAVGEFHRSPRCAPDGQLQYMEVTLRARPSTPEWGSVRLKIEPEEWFNFLPYAVREVPAS
jgi:hypothetical protein